MVVLESTIWLLGLLGHVELWVLYWNHVEGSGRPRLLCRWLGLLGVVCCLTLPLLVVVAAPASLTDGNVLRPQTAAQLASVLYLAFCACFAAAITPALLWQKYRVARTCPVRETRTVIHRQEASSAPSAGASGRVHWLLRLPGNQSLEIEQNEKHLELPQLPPALNGLTIAHLSDFHLTGRVGKGFFERVVDLTNAMDADLIAITGDLIDKEPYLCWLPSLLGRLRARDGIYFILGNHDLKVDLRKLRLAMSEAGLRGLGGNWLKYGRAQSSIVLAGNERPWIGAAPDMSKCPAKSERQLRVLLAHTPDQLPFARQHEFDLMLAGHTHGGQIRLPGVGAVVCPCRGPLAHAAGTIDAFPTVLHVSRGVSAEHPIRLNCRPELTKLVLCRPTAGRRGEQQRSTRPEAASS